MPAVQGLMDLLGVIGNATYKPQLNPDLYGVDQNGNFVDKNGQPVTPYQTPSWFNRAFSQNARDVGMANAQSMESPFAHKQATAEELTSAGAKRDYMARNLANSMGMDEPNQQITGTAGIAGTDSFRTGISPKSPIESEVSGLEYQHGVPESLAGAARREALANELMASGKEQAAPFMAQNLFNEAKYVQPSEMMRREAEAENIGLGGSSWTVGHITPEGDIEARPNPVRSLQGVMMQNYMPGQGLQTITLPSGKTMSFRPKDQGISVPSLTYSRNPEESTRESLAGVDDKEQNGTGTKTGTSTVSRPALGSDLTERPHGLGYIAGHTLLDTPDWLKAAGKYMTHDEILSRLASMITGE